MDVEHPAAEPRYEFWGQQAHVPREQDEPGGGFHSAADERVREPVVKGRAVKAAALDDLGPDTVVPGDVEGPHPGLVADDQLHRRVLDEVALRCLEDRLEVRTPAGD